MSRRSKRRARANRNEPPPLTWRYLFHGQFAHLLLLLALIPGARYIAEPSLTEAVFLGLTDRQWLNLAIGVAVAHHVVTWLGWRVQLIWAGLTRIFGPFDMAVWAIVFFPLLLARPVTVLGLGISNAGTLSGPWILYALLGAVLLAPALYTFWSVKRYFGLLRAMGGDHFRLEYVEMPLVREGAFRYVDNAMYTLGFLLFWAIALLCGSQAALGVALFQHAYIWVHMYCTENPDMQYLYGRSGLGNMI